MVTAAFFDVDRTLLEGSSLLALARPLRHAGLLPVPTVLRAAFNQIWFALLGYSDDQLDGAAVAVAAAVAGIEVAALTEAGRVAIPRYVVPRIYDDARTAIAAHRANGDKVFLVSSAPIELVSELGRLLGVDGVAASVAEVSNGRYTGRLTSFCHGQAKAAAVRDLARIHGIDLAASSAYGDALSDLPMLNSVGHPVAVNADRRLRAVANALNWEQRRFRGHRGPAAPSQQQQPLRPRPHFPGIA